MQVAMTVRTLIDLARAKSGLSLQELANDLGRSQSRLSEWKSGKAIPDANEIAYFAEKAGLPVLETVAEIEAGMNSRYAWIWEAALGKLRAAGVAATVTFTLATSSMLMTSNESHAGMLTDQSSITSGSAR